MSGDDRNQVDQGAGAADAAGYKKSERATEAAQIRDEAARAICEALEEGQTMESAARAGGIAYRTLFDWRRGDPRLDEQVKAASAVGRSVRAEKIARALYAGAEKCADDPRFTTCAIFALKNLDPAHWRDQHDISGPGGSPIAISIIQFGQPDDDPAEKASGFEAETSGRP